MYGHFSDVTPAEFVEVQLDMSEYRLRWDESTSQCYVIEEEGSLAGGLGNLSHIYYWEVNWPRFFANRDGVVGVVIAIINDFDITTLVCSVLSRPI